MLHPRLHHLAWHGITLRHDHPFWQTHSAPNGWGCQCRITTVTKREGEASAKAGLGEPPEGWRDINPKTGEPIGIDKGFGFQPGANVATPLQKMVDEKLIKLDGPLGAAMWQAVKPVLMAERLAIWQDMLDTTRASMQAVNTTVMVHTLEPAVVAELAMKHGVVVENSAVWMRDAELLHSLRDTKTDRGAVLPDSIWRDLPILLEAAAPYFDAAEKDLIYAIDLGKRLGKLVVKVNFNLKGRFDGQRANIKSNFIQTGGVVDRFNLKEDRYVPIEK